VVRMKQAPKWRQPVVLRAGRFVKLRRCAKLKNYTVSSYHINITLFSNSFFEHVDAKWLLVYPRALRITH